MEKTMIRMSSFILLAALFGLPAAAQTKGKSSTAPGASRNDAWAAATRCARIGQRFRTGPATGRSGWNQGSCAGRRTTEEVIGYSCAANARTRGRHLASALAASKMVPELDRRTGGAENTLV